mmetsp:Transcript_88638/g.225681  ORF Transcript_88638/g.225681 Transcript_88638/m.225681 type:complete len:295 (+) Transcript_88638:79-963(+)
MGDVVDIAEEEQLGALVLVQEKRPLDADALAIEPSKRARHSGLFRDNTISFVLKAADRIRQSQDAEPAALMEMLEELTDCVIDETVLLRTNIGKEVAVLQKNTDAEVSAKARALVTQWKRDRETRLKVVKHFQERAQLSVKDSKKLEDGIFNFACPWGFSSGDDKKAYQRHYLRLSTHLKEQGPGALIERLRAGELKPEDLAFRPDEELMSATKREKIEAVRLQGLKEALATTGAEADGTVSTEYMCPRCRSSHCIYKDVQTGWHNDQQDVTILVNCLDCGERWKANDEHGCGS